MCSIILYVHVKTQMYANSILLKKVKEHKENNSVM